MTECEPVVLQQAGKAATQYGGPALVIQSGSRTTLKVGPKDELEARLRDWLSVVAAGQSGGVLSPEIEDFVRSVWTLLSAGLSIALSRKTDGEGLEGSNVH